MIINVFQTRNRICLILLTLTEDSPIKNKSVESKEEINIDDSGDDVGDGIEHDFSGIPSASVFQATNDLSISSVDVNWLSGEIIRLQEEQSKKRNLRTLLEKYTKTEDPVLLNLKHLHPGIYIFIYLTHIRVLSYKTWRFHSKVKNLYYFVWRQI